MALFEGEELVAGHCPLLVHTNLGATDRPAVVFLPGAVHLARIAYGDPSSQHSDFLGHWFAERAHTFVAYSYPAIPSDPVFTDVDPSLRLDVVVDAVGDHVANLVATYDLPREVIVVAWSALGNAAPGLTAQLARRGIEAGTFVSLAATPPLPNLILGSLETSRAMVGEPRHLNDGGLLRASSLRSETFFAELRSIEAELGRPVIDEATYVAHYLADMPMNVFPGLEAQVGPDGTTVGHAGPLDTSGGGRWADYPLCAAIVPTHQRDARHVITDAANWTMVNANAIQWRWLAGRDLPAIPHDRWARIVHAADRLASSLSLRLEGGHFFFVGEPGARSTVDAVLELDARRRQLQSEFLAELEG